MIFFYRFILSLPLAIIAISLISNKAQAAYFSPLTGYTAEELEREIQNGSFVEEFSASSFIGDRGMTAYELELKDIIPPNDVDSTQTEQFLWKNNQKVDFELSFDGTTLSYTVGDKVIQSIDVVEEQFEINGMILSATSTDNSSVTIGNLMFEDGSMSMDNLSANKGNTDFLKITGLDHKFKLTGTQTFAWRGKRPSNFELAYQIRVGSFQDPRTSDVVEVPEPQTLSWLSLGAIACLFKAVRKRVISQSVSTASFEQ
jgi:hypothetical protein